MNERILNKQEDIDVDKLFMGIVELRALSVTSIDLNEKLTRLVKVWNDDFRLKLIEKYGSTKYAQQVPVWQKLIGGSVEEERDVADKSRIPDEARELIVSEVNKAFQEIKSDFSNN